MPGITIGKNQPAKPAQPGKPSAAKPQAPKLSLPGGMTQKQIIGIALIVVGLILVGVAILTW